MFAARFVVVGLLAAVALLAGLRSAPPAGAAFPGGNGRIAFARFENGSYYIYVINPDGSGETKLSPDGLVMEQDPAWSPDGTKIAFTRLENNLMDIYVMDADGSNRTLLTDVATSSDTSPAWSPDGTKIAYVHEENATAREIYVMDANGGNKTRLTFGGGQNYYPAWSPDGTKIAFGRDTPNDHEIYVMDADGTDELRLTDNTAFDVLPKWSPDGSKILYTTWDGDDFELMVMDADGSDETQLTDNNWPDINGNWSPDGTKIVYSSDTAGGTNFQLYIINADGSGTPIRLTDNQFSDQIPDWQPLEAARLTVTKLTDPGGGEGFPFTMTAFVDQWSMEGGEFLGMTTDSAGHLYAAHFGLASVLKYSSDGTMLSELRGSPNDPGGDIRRPFDVAVDEDGFIYLTDYYDHVIRKFTSDGDYVTHWGDYGDDNSQFDIPLGIAVDADGYVYVADSDNDRIQKFNSDGDYVTQWGISGSAAGQFDQPFGVAVDAANNVYVTDNDNNRVQKFDSDGNFLDLWISDMGPNPFLPYDIAIDWEGNVYVGDGGNNRVLKFDGDGKLLGHFGRGISHPNYFTYGIAVDPSGNVYVNDRNSIISKFTQFEVTLDHEESYTFTSLVPGEQAISELVPNGWELDDITCDGGNPAIINDTALVTLSIGDHVECTFTNIQDVPPVETAIFMTTKTAGTMYGDQLAYGPEDILKWDGNVWTPWFDGSAALLMPGNKKAKHNINAIWIPDPNGTDVVMSFAQARRLVPGITMPVDGTDLVSWNNVDGFSFYLDGSDVGLDKKGPEKIDGLHVLPGDAAPDLFENVTCVAYLLISTQGPGRVSNYGGGTLKFSGEDVLGFCATRLGAETTGFWHLVLDGSENKLLPKNAINGISLSADGLTLYLTTQKPLRLYNGAVTGGHSNVFAYDLNSKTVSGPHFAAPNEGLTRMATGLEVSGPLP